VCVPWEEEEEEEFGDCSSTVRLLLYQGKLISILFIIKLGFIEFN